MPTESYPTDGPKECKPSDPEETGTEDLSEEWPDPFKDKKVI